LLWSRKIGWRKGKPKSRNIQSCMTIQSQKSDNTFISHHADKKRRGARRRSA
jgi:hypothetical protein